MDHHISPPQLLPLICPFSRTVQIQGLEDHRWDAISGLRHLVVLGSGFWGADPWPQCFCSHSVKLTSAAPCARCWGQCGEKRTEQLPVPHGAHSLVGRGQAVTITTGDPGSTGEKAKTDLAERRRQNWSGEEDSDSGSRLNVLSTPGGQGGSREVT